MKSGFFTIILFLSMTLGVAAQGVKAPAYPPELDGTMMPYRFAPEDTLRAWPDSLKPVYLAYVARHGARFLSSESKVRKLEKMLYDKAVGKKMTPAGKKLSALLAEINRNTAGRWGQLSQVGIDEERQLGINLSVLLPEIMKKGEVSAISSYVPRVVTSMYELSRSLALRSSHIGVSTSEGRTYSPYVRFFDTDSAYSAYRKNGDWKEVYDDYLERVVPYQPALRILGPDHGMSRRELREVTMDIYSVVQSLRAAGLAPQAEEFMSVEEYEACWKASNLARYLRNTVTPLSSEAGKSASVLLNRIIADAELNLTAPEGERKNACMYFGHAETLMPLLSIMRLPGCFALPLDYDNLWKEWNDAEVVPLGANLRIIFLESESGNIYTTLMLNGSYIRPWKDASYIVPWPELRLHWESC